MYIVLRLECNKIHKKADTQAQILLLSSLIYMGSSRSSKRSCLPPFILCYAPVRLAKQPFIPESQQWTVSSFLSVKTVSAETCQIKTQVLVSLKHNRANRSIHASQTSAIWINYVQPPWHARRLSKADLPQCSDTKRLCISITVQKSASQQTPDTGKLSRACVKHM